MVNPYKFVEIHPEIEKITFVQKCDFLNSCPEIPYKQKKALLAEYSPEDIDELFRYYYKLYVARTDRKEAIWL